MDVGLYGKLPSHGDFLRRRASDEFVDVWDGWLQDGMAASRAVLGDRWLDVYLTSPVWRFACSAGVCGGAPVIGLLAPSVDRVGRYFPLTLVADLPSHVNVISLVREVASFFASAERLVIETLEADYVDFEHFDANVHKLRDELAPLAVVPTVMLDASASAILGEEKEASWQLPIGSSVDLGPVLEQLLSHRLSALYAPVVLWWTEGSANVEPSCLITRRLPSPEAFTAFLDGRWRDHRWRAIDAHVARDLSIENTLLSELPPLRYVSAGATDAGRVRQINQDAFLERPEIGLWVVADGLGGHTDGHVASRMVCDALADFDPRSSFDAAIEAARARVYQVNDHLLRTSARSLLADRSGSTVVVLMVRGTECVVLWAGDSRAYRLRDGRLQQLTRDHSVAAESVVPVSREESHLVTRAVGVSSTLSLDTYRDQVRPGDRFLLCSDGLTRVLSEEEIKAWMENDNISLAVDGLIKATLKGGAPDNVTALIAEAKDSDVVSSLLL